MYPTIEEMKTFSQLLKGYFRKRDWDGAIKVLLADVEMYPDEYFSYASLSQVYVNKEEYPIALEYAAKAYRMGKEDPWIVYVYADALMYNGEYRKGIGLMRKILKMDIDEIAYGRGGEGMKYAK